MILKSYLDVSETSRRQHLGGTFNRAGQHWFHSKRKGWKSIVLLRFGQQMSVLWYILHFSIWPQVLLLGIVFSFRIMNIMVNTKINESEQISSLENNLEDYFHDGSRDEANRNNVLGRRSQASSCTCLSEAKRSTGQWQPARKRKQGEPGGASLIYLTKKLQLGPWVV